ncbi:MAG: alpha/beta hydrolase [Erysipelotrichaceae bacterium]
MGGRRRRPIFLATLVFLLGMGLYLKSQMQVPALSQTAPANLVKTASYQALGKEESIGFVVFRDEQIAKEAYYPLMEALHQQCDATVVLVEYPLNMASLSRGRVNQAKKAYPSVRQWVLIGHGEVGNTMVSQRQDDDALVFYGTSLHKNLRALSNPSLSIYPERNGLLVYEDYQKQLGNFPSNTHFVELEGANYSYLANVTPLAQDHVAKWSVEEQLNFIVETVKNWITTIK